MELAAPRVVERHALMAESLVSGSWHRVAALRPSLAAGLRIVRQVVRGDVWHLLLEPATGRQVRLNPAAYDLVGRFDGRATMAQLWQRVLRLRGEAAPTQDEALALLAQLFRAGMVQFDAAPHLSLLFARRAQEGEQRRRGFINPMFLRARLFDPGPLLQRLTPLARAVFSLPALVAWLLLVGWACFAAGAEYAALKAHALDLLRSPASLAIAWLCYPLVKAVHELGHGLAVRRFGGEVREAGISLMVLTPAPYVDASAANAFALPRHRLAVSAAGILVELALAALALVLWLAITPGVVRDVALVVFLICSISTLAFNGNPLLRLDGYYVLCDALQLPNLAARSQAWWVRRWRRFTQPSDRLPEPQLAPGERKWLVAYAPASWLYRIGLFLAVVFWVGQQSWMLGWIAGLFLFGWLARSFWRALEGTGDRGRRAAILAVAAVLVLLFTVPAPHNVVARGVVWPPAHAQLRAESAGFVQHVGVADGGMASPGEPVLVLEEPGLAARRDRLAAERAGLQVQHHAALLTEPATALRLQSELERNEAELVRAEEQLALLEVRPAVAGRVAWLRPQDLPGSFARRGSLLGHIVTPAPGQVRLALPEEDYSRVGGEVRAVEVRLAEDPATVHEAQLLPALPGASMELPVPALGDRHGGPIAVDAADPEGLRTRAPVFLLDVAVPQLRTPRIGERAWVKLSLPPEPWGWQAWRRLTQLFIKQFHPGGRL